jgi:hypothetical protein
MAISLLGFGLKLNVRDTKMALIGPGRQQLSNITADVKVTCAEFLLPRRLFSRDLSTPNLDEEAAASWSSQLSVSSSSRAGYDMSFERPSSGSVTVVRRPDGPGQRADLLAGEETVVFTHRSHQRRTARGRNQG